MRILHVSDLHLGRSLGDLSREPEQRAVMNEIIAAADELEVALTVISGDVFDAFTPPAWTEDLFFELLDGLAAGGQRAVAVIAGNHDSGLRVAAAEPLARRLGIVLAGSADEPLRGFDGGGGRVRVKPIAMGAARIEVPGAELPIAIGLLPFLSEARVARDEDVEDLSTSRADASRYTERLAREVTARGAAIAGERSAARILAMHQFIAGAAASDSERRLRIGGFADLDAAELPYGLDYIALGHLHRPQAIEGAPSPACYAGSPISYSFSEAGQQKRAVLIDLAPGRAARISSVPLHGGRPLEVWSVASIDEARDLAFAAATRNPIVEVRANLGRRLDTSDGDALFELGRDVAGAVTVVSVRDLYDPSRYELSATAEGELPEMRVEELFCELWAKKHGAPPDEETLAELMGALLEAQRGEERAGERGRSPREGAG